MWLEMKVKGLALDPLSNMPMIILRDEEEKRSLPIWVGLFEANAIALELEKISTPRPMTHDLIKNILESLDARVQKVVVNDLRDNTFYAVIHLRLGSADITVDSRPSDAIALALRVGAPIFVEEDVVHKARSVEVAKETEIGTGKGDDQAKIKEWLESLKPGDFDRIERGKDPKSPDE
jgi:bifunctional DNase/RNase